MLVANSSGSIASSNAVLTIHSPPAVKGQPVGQLALFGCAINFQVSATGTAPLHYQWSQDGTALPNETNLTLVIPDVQPAETGGIIEW